MSYNKLLSDIFMVFFSFRLIMQTPFAPYSISFASLMNCTGQYIANFIHSVITDKGI